MRELAPGLWHWTARHEGIGTDVSSYLVAPAGVAIDPMVPTEGLDALVERAGRPEQIVLTSGNHTRHAARFARELDIPIRVSPEGAERIAGALDAELYHDGEDIAPGVRPIRLGVLSGDEYALHITAAGPAIAFADGVVHYGRRLAFVSDGLLGDDPPAIRRGLRERFRSLLPLDFDLLLFAHGAPVTEDAKTALREFAAARPEDG